MAKKITELTELTTSSDVHGTDELIINDRSDTTQSADGSTKRLLVSTLSGAIGGSGGSSGGSSGGGSSDSIASSTQNTMVSAYEPTGDSAIRFVVDGSRKLDIDSTGSIIPLSGSGIGTVEYPLGSSIIGDHSLWIGQWAKIIANSNKGLSVAIRGTKGSKKPAVVQTVETYTQSSGTSHTVESWHQQELSLSSQLNYEQIPLYWILEFVRQNGDPTSSLDYANYTIDDVFPSPGMPGYTADDWSVVLPVVLTSPAEYTDLSYVTRDENGSTYYKLVDMTSAGGTDSRIDWSNVESTHNRLDFNFSKYPPAATTHTSVLVDNMSDDFIAVRYTDSSTNTTIAGDVRERTVGSFDNTADYNACEFKFQTYATSGNTYYLQIDSTKLTGNETAMYSQNGDKFYNNGGYDLYQILDGDGGNPVSSIYVYMYSSGSQLTGGETVDAGSGTNFGGLEWGNVAVATATNSDGFATEFYVVQQSLNVLVTKTYHNYSDATSQQPWQA